MNNISCPCGRTRLPSMPGSLPTSMVPTSHVTPDNAPCSEESVEWLDRQKTRAVRPQDVTP